MRLGELASLIRDQCQTTPGRRTLVVLVGYSQGAEVVHRAINERAVGVSGYLAGVALIADPWFDPTAPSVHFMGSFDSGRHGVRRPLRGGPVLAWAADQTVSVCNENDIVCQFYPLPWPFWWFEGEMVHGMYYASARSRG